MGCIMRKLLLSTVAFAAISSTALAADLPSRPAPVAPVYVPIFTWTGLYVGLNAGVGWADNTTLFVDDSLLRRPARSASAATPASSAAARSATTARRAPSCSVSKPTSSTPTSRRTPIGRLRYSFNGGGSQYFGTVRGRVGYAFDRVLIYVTGGLAYGDV